MYIILNNTLETPHNKNSKIYTKHARGLLTNTIRSSELNTNASHPAYKYIGNQHNTIKP